jgi:hypothetical protein
MTAAISLVRCSLKLCISAGILHPERRFQSEPFELDLNFVLQEQKIALIC